MKRVMSLMVLTFGIALQARADQHWSCIGKSWESNGRMLTQIADISIAKEIMNYQFDIQRDDGAIAPATSVRATLKYNLAENRYIGKRSRGRSIAISMNNASGSTEVIEKIRHLPDGCEDNGCAEIKTTLTQLNCREL